MSGATKYCMLMFSASWRMRTGMGEQRVNSVTVPCLMDETAAIPCNRMKHGDVGSQVKHGDGSTASARVSMKQ